jgi:hypothetical protein
MKRENSEQNVFGEEMPMFMLPSARNTGDQGANAELLEE